MEIEYLSFICFMGRIHLDHSALSSSSFMKSSFLIQMIRWIRGSPRIEFFSYSSSLEGSSLNGESLIFNCSHLLPLFLLVELKVITYFWHTFFSWMNPMIMGGHSRWLSPLLHSLLLLLPLQDVMHSGSSHSSTVFSNPSSELCSYLQISWSRNQTYLVSLGKTLVVQVDPWLNQQWYSWPWSSSSCVRLWGSSPSRTGTSLLM